MADEKPEEKKADDKGKDGKGKDDKGAPAKPEKAAPKANPLVTGLLLINSIGVAVIGFMQFTFNKRITDQPSIQDIVKSEIQSQIGVEESMSDAAVAKSNIEGLLLPLESFVANLAQGDGPRRFIRLNAVLKFNKDSKESEFKAKKPQIRDAIISILNAKRPEDILNEEGKGFLKEEIKSAINAFLVEGSVVDVYYVGFQIN